MYDYVKYLSGEIRHVDMKRFAVPTLDSNELSRMISNKTFFFIIADSYTSTIFNVAPVMNLHFHSFNPPLKNNKF